MSRQPQSQPRERPPFTEADARQVVLELWGETAASARPLAGDRDRNFRIEAEDGHYMLKFVFRGEDPAYAAAQCHALRAAAAAGLEVPTPLDTTGGGPVGMYHDHQVLLFRWIEGRPYADFRPQGRDLLEAVGKSLADLDRALAGLEEPAFERPFDWDVARLAAATAPRMGFLKDREHRGLVERHIRRFEEAEPILRRLPRQVIHNDVNEHNVLVRPGKGAAYPIPAPEIGYIDFGDMVLSWRAAELGVAGAYLAMGHEDPVDTFCRLAAGYHSVLPLSEAELEAIPHLVAARLCISVCHSAERALTEPDDPYQTISQAGAWDLLKRLDSVPPGMTTYRLRGTCGMEPVPHAERVRNWLRTASPANMLEEPLRGPVLDLSVGTTQFDGALDPTDAKAWEAPLAREMNAAGATMAFGRYLEPRICYRSGHFKQVGLGPERQRTIHLGVDIFAPAGTGIHAPFDGEVEHVVNNAQDLDYGPTVILRHDADGVPFWTLYGHLGAEALHRLKPGDRVKAGERFGDLGADDINGGWPPHLHFQVYLDLFDSTGNMPGVALPALQSVWESVSPDPELIMRTGLPLRFEPPPDLVQRRRTLFGPNLSLSYHEPLHMVRGIGTHLFDQQGRAYLDCVNNVCHLGHAHPAVVEAAASQLSILNTNTRYLHENILQYATALSGTLPAPLEVCFLVNSGSEANDLALRLARAATGRRGVIVLDGGYHGNLSSLIEVSAYKFDGPGGEGPPGHVAKALMPDPFRQRDLSAADMAADVARAARELDKRAFAPAAFLAEAILSCGGQIDPPEGYLSQAYRHARAAGAVCIADEVQTGFGRVGTHMWAFEAHGAVPDIVTMGKPIGNGFPLGAVVTTRAIAEAFAGGMEYFNTFGGNPVSSAVGLAVLRTIGQEGLQGHAHRVGVHLRRGLEELMGRHRLVADVRGRGLFLGVELVRDRESLEPADTEARYVVNRMKDHGVLLSTDGPLHNVIKIKPPLPFSTEDADEVIQKLDMVLADEVLR